MEKIERNLKVLYRASPTEKLLLVLALKDNPANIVSVIGDGTNDAPSLHSADVRIAMSDGTEIAKNASDFILLDNNIRSITTAIKWGRNLHGKAMKFIQSHLTFYISAIFMIFIGSAINGESSIITVHML